MRPIHLMGAHFAAMALLASGSVAVEPLSEGKSRPEPKPEPLMTPDGYRKQHQGLRERTRRMKQQAKIAAKAPPQDSAETEAGK